MLPSRPARCPTKHLHLIGGNDALFKFWSDSIGLAADHHEKIVAVDVIRREGVVALYDLIIERVVDSEISLLLIDVSVPWYDPFVISDLKHTYNLMVVLLAIDDEFKYDWISSSYATIADLVLTTDHVSVGRYRQAGINAHFFSLPIHIPPEVPAQDKGDLKYGVSFVGRVDGGKPSRAEFARFLARNDIDVSFFASRGEDDPLFLSRDAMYSVFRTSLINLSFVGISTYRDSFDHILHERTRGYKVRPFEIAAAGGFCISEYSISLAALLQDGVDIVFFRSKAELLAKIQYFRDRPDEARRIAANGARKIREQFSPDAVARKVADLVRDSWKHAGTDLYGEPHQVRVAREFASTFLVMTLSNAVLLLRKGEWHGFFNDSWSAARFMSRISVDVGIRGTLTLAFCVLYGVAKNVLATIRSHSRAAVGGVRAVLRGSPSE